MRSWRGESQQIIWCYADNVFSTLCMRVRYNGSREDLLESPDTVLMKICIVSSVSDALELRLDVLLERCIVCGVMRLLWWW